MLVSSEVYIRPNLSCLVYTFVESLHTQCALNLPTVVFWTNWKAKSRLNMRKITIVPDLRSCKKTRRI